jgi:hypothetical protein
MYIERIMYPSSGILQLNRIAKLFTCQLAPLYNRLHYLEPRRGHIIITRRCHVRPGSPLTNSSYVVLPDQARVLLSQ